MAPLSLPPDLLSFRPGTTHGSETEGGILGLVIVFGAVASFIALLLILSRRQRKAWLAIGDGLGLVPERRGGGRPPLAGRLGPHHVRLVAHTSTRTRRNTRPRSPSAFHVQLGGASIASGPLPDETARSYVVMEVTTPNAPLTFDLLVRPTGLVGRIATRLGAEDIEVGQADFDRRFRIRSNDPVLARHVLNGEVGPRLLALPHFEELRVGGGTIWLRRSGSRVKGETTRDDLEAVLALAGRFASAAPEAAPPAPPAAPRAPPWPSFVAVQPR